MQASNSSVMVHLEKAPLLSNTKFTCDSLKRTLKDEKKHIMSMNFIKKLECVSHIFPLGWKCCWKKWICSKIEKKDKILLTILDYFSKHVGKRKTTMIVKGVAKWVLYHVENNYDHKNEIAYTSTCKDNVVQQLNIVHVEEENTKWILSIPTWGVGILKCFKFLGLGLN